MKDMHIIPWWQQLLLGMAFATVVLATALGVAVTLRWLLSLSPSLIQWIAIGCVVVGSLVCTVIIVGIIIGSKDDDDYD